MKARFAFLGAAIFAGALAACGGGGGGSSPVPTARPTITPTGPPTPVTITLSAQPTTAPIPGNVSGTILIPAGSGTLTVVASSKSPTALPSLAPNSPLEFFTATATGGPVTANGLPGFTVTLPSGAPPGPYFVAYYSVPGEVTPGPQAPAWVSTSASGALPVNGVVTIPATTTPTISLANGQPLYLAVYTGAFIPPINVYGCVGVNQSTPAPQPARRPALIGTHPITPGDAYNYSGTLAQTMVRSQPCPQPTATANAIVAIAVTMGNGVENSIETDAYATNTTILNTAANVSLQSGKYLESSETATDGNGNTVVTNYGATPLQFGQLPEGAGGWTNSSPASVTQTLADTTAIARVYSSGGAYTETETLPGGNGTNVVTVNPDASGSYAICAHCPPGVFPYTVKFAAPSAGNVIITLGTQTLVLPVWYPTPVKLYSDVTTDLGTVSALPAGCTFVSANGGTPDHLQRLVQIVDPVLGYIESETVDSYDLVNYAGSTTLGPVCTSISDTLNQYYDYSLTSPFGFFFSHVPVITDTISEQFSLSRNGLIANTAGRNARQAFAAQLIARQAGIRFARTLQRSRQRQAMARAVTQNLRSIR
ncbi:MAG: hypothetical protein M3R51_01880 [Candidatus Eremiobacteraeota bacterium]|nr:hypothetical protein [Candidatus Eremiobacteraeota bacterium]